MKNKLIIAGPCSAETEEQVLQTAIQLKETTKVNMLRAGIWKPRTRPGSFEGVGAIGLKWLIDAGKQVNLPVTTEVANREHVNLALKAGFKNLWIGARTTVNPFAVQEIADSLQGVSDVSVLIKNPINPDLQLWIGATERFQKAGIKNIGVIHRGFSAFKTNKYRNEPLWEIPLNLKMEFPDIQLICDPSHICGRRDILEEVSQKAMDLEYDGLMIETHIAPNDAWSDAKQQVTPIVLNQLLNNLVRRNAEADNPKFEKLLDTFRNEMKGMDNEILSIIGKRMKIAEQIGIIKKENNITILQRDRWQKVLNLISDIKMLLDTQLSISMKTISRNLGVI